MMNRLLSVIALSLSRGELFLPDASSYDDLFYKLVEASDTLTNIKESYGLGDNLAMAALTHITSHYTSMLKRDEKYSARSKTLSPAEVSRLIKEGYDTLSIQARDGFDRWQPFREAEHKATIKRAARIVAEDIQTIIYS